MPTTEQQRPRNSGPHPPDFWAAAASGLPNAGVAAAARPATTGSASASHGPSLDRVEPLSHVPADVGPASRPAGPEGSSYAPPHDGGPAPPQDSDVLRQADLERWEKGALERLQSTLMAGVTAAFKSEVGALTTLVTNSTASLDRKIADNSSRITDVSGEVEDLREKQERMAEQIGQLKDAVAFTSKSKLEPFEYGSSVWDRPPDPTIIFCGGASLVSRKSVEALFLAELRRLEIPTDGIKVLGNDHTLSKRYKILFDVGTQGRAATFITKFMDSLRGEDGVWRSLHVDSPSSGPVQVYFNRDQSPQQGAIEKFGKK